MSLHTKPLVLVVENDDRQRHHLEALLQKRAYRTHGFASRTGAWMYLNALQDTSNLPVAVLTDIVTGNTDIKLQKFLEDMNIRHPSTRIFIVTQRPSLLSTEQIITPLNTRGCYHRDTETDVLLRDLAQSSEKLLQQQPLVFVIEDYESERRRIEGILQRKGYKTRGFASRQEVWDHLKGLSHSEREKNIPIAIITDVAVKDDMKMERFLNDMNMHFSSVAIFVSTVQPATFYKAEIVPPPNFRGCYARAKGFYLPGHEVKTPGMDELLNELEQVSHRTIHQY